MSDSTTSQAKLLRVLEILASADKPLQLGEVAKSARISKPSAHRLLASLLDERYAQRDGEDRYMRGPGLLILGAQTARHQREVIFDSLQRLRNHTGQTVHLAMRSHDHAIYTEKVTGTGAIQFASTVGARLELHASAIGKVILAGLPEDERTALMSTLSLDPRTAHTIVDTRHLVAEVRTVEELGYAIDDEENEENVRCLAVGLNSPNGEAIGGISLSTVKPLLPKGQLMAMLPTLKAAADDVEPLL